MPGNALGRQPDLLRYRPSPTARTRVRRGPGRRSCACATGPRTAPGAHAAFRYTGPRSGSDTREGGPVRALAAALLALALPLGAVLPSVAQADVLVSNLNQGSQSTATVGESAGSQITLAVRFETGSHSKGYTLSSIKAALSSAVDADGVRVRLFSATTFGVPDNSVLTFDNPTISNGVRTFTAPANTSLEKDTRYFLVFDSTATNASYQLGTTESDVLTSSVAGWKLNTDRHFRFSGGSWTEHYATLRVGINGLIKPDATGKPGITGFPQAGQSLTASVDDIIDADGLPDFPSGFAFQWVRVDGATETDIPGATSSAYEPVGADVGKQLKVKVSYTDNDGAAEGPLESDPTAEAVLAAPAPCRPRSDWCAEMTVGQGTGTSVPLGFGVGSNGTLNDTSIEYRTSTYEVNAIWLLTDPDSSTNTVALTLDRFLPRGSVFHIAGARFIADASSEQAVSGQYQWAAPAGFSWVEGQQVTASIRVAPPVVTIEATKTEAVYGAERIGFNVLRANNTVGALDVDVVLTDYRGHLPESALSRTITIPDGIAGTGFFIQPGDFRDLNDGNWIIRPGTITGKVVKRPGYRLGSPSSVNVKMNYAMTVGFWEESYRVDEGTRSVDITFYATTGEGMGRPTHAVEVEYSTAAGTATAGDFNARSGSVSFVPSDFRCIAGGYDGCDLARDGHRATKTVTLTNVIKEDTTVEGDETFRVVLDKSADNPNPKSVVYVDDRGIRGVSCTPGSTCAAEITIVDNDGISTPTEHPDWTLEGSDRTFAGTSSNRPPAISGTESTARCLDGHTPFRLLNEGGNRITSGIEYSLRQIPGNDVAPYAGLPKPSEMLDLFTIDDKGQIRTVAGESYLHYEDSGTQLRYTDVIVRALQTSSNRYAEYRLGFNVIHPSRTDKNYLIDCDDDSTKSPQAPLTGQVQNAPGSHDGSTAFSFRILFSEDVDIEPDALRDDAIKVSHATVTAAARVDGRDDLWEVTLTPKAAQAISIQLRGQLECTQDAAICTADGKKLAANVTHSVAYAAPGTRGTRNPPALTASFENGPSSHDGSDAFTVELAFSAAVFDGTESFNKNARVRNAVSITGGTLTDFRRTDAAAFDRWRLSIRPSGNGDVTVTLPVTTSCSATNAICTPGGTALSAGATATIEGPGAVEAPQPATLTAAFVSVPSSHDGSNGFTVDLAFSAAVFDGTESFNKNARIRNALSIAGGTLVNFRRVNPAVFDRWRLRIRPSGNGDVTLSLPPTTSCSATNAICTPGGTPLSGSTTATIQGPATLSVADATVEEGPGAELAFVITLSRAVSQAVTVDFATSDGSATAGVDYTAKSETVTFAAGTISKTVNVAVLDDDHDEGDEAMTVTLSNASGAVIADGTATGTIENTDLMPRAWLARFGRTAADQVIDAVEGRMGAARAPGTKVNLAGQRVGAEEDDALDAAQADAGPDRFAEWLRGAGAEDEASALTSRAPSGRELLSGTSFALTAGSAESGFGALWGRGAVSRLDGREGDVTLDGESASALLGADFTRGRGTAGLVVAHSLGEGGYRSPRGEGEVETTLTGLYPWGRYAASERLSLWGVAGYGAGSLTLTPEDQAPIETDMALTMAALGGRGVLAEAPAEGGLELSLTSDALLVRTTSEAVRGSPGNLAASEADVTRLRLGLEGTWRGLGTLVPALEVGARHDGGDAETGFGADIGGRLAWSDPALGIEAELAARGLLTHEDGSLSERGVAGSLAWDPSPDTERGTKLTLRQAVGAEATRGMDALLRPGTARVLEAGNDDGRPERRRLEARMGYGIALFGGGWTGVPEVGLGLTEASREYIHAWRLREARDAGLVFGLDVEGVRNERLDGDAAPGHRVGLGFGWELVGARREDLELRFQASRLLPANDDPESRIGVTLTARW